MNKETLNKAVEICKAETKEALQTVFDELNNGQQKKLLKSEKINPEIFNQFIGDYSGKFPVTVYTYLGNKQTKLNDTQTTVYIDRNICCSVKNELKRKIFARWNEKGFGSLQNFLKLTI